VGDSVKRTSLLQFCSIGPWSEKMIRILKKEAKVKRRITCEKESDNEFKKIEIDKQIDRQIDGKKTDGQTDRQIDG
jgi:hypothetical protein